MYKSFLHYEYRVVENLGKDKNGRGCVLVRSVFYKTIEEAQAKMETMVPKENGILEIEKRIITF